MRTNRRWRKERWKLCKRIPARRVRSTAGLHAHTDTPHWSSTNQRRLRSSSVGSYASHAQAKFLALQQFAALPSGPLA